MDTITKEDARLNEAREFCLEKGLNFTPMRQRVYREIAKHGSIGAYEIARRLSSSKLQINAVSVYRVLDFLLEVGLVYKINSCKKYAVSPLKGIDDTEKVSVVLVCTKTGAATKYQSEALTECIANFTAGIGFDMSRVVVEIEGDGRLMHKNLREAS